MKTKTQPAFEGFTEIPAEVVRRDYNILSGNLADAVLERASASFRERFPNFPGMNGTLRLLDGELAGSNLPVLAGLNGVDLSEFGIEVCDERDLARMYNEEVARLKDGKPGFFAGKYWFDVALVRNPHAVQKELAPWEQELEDGINALHGNKAVVSVPYRAIVPVVIDRDNFPFGRVRSYGFRLNPDVKDAVRVIEVSAKGAHERYDFSGLDAESAFPVKGRGERFYGISENKRFSRLSVHRDLSAGNGGHPLFSYGGARVVFKSAEGTREN